eukprot:1161425-Pelagomonas_calceolata.AAC.6
MRKRKDRKHTETHPLAAQVVQVDLARRCSELVTLVEDRQKILHALDLAIAKLQREAEKVPMVCASDVGVRKVAGSAQAPAAIAADAAAVTHDKDVGHRCAPLSLTHSHSLSLSLSLSLPPPLFILAMPLISRKDAWVCVIPYNIIDHVMRALASPRVWPGSPYPNIQISMLLVPMPQVKEDFEMSVLDYKYDLSLVNEAIKAIQLGQQGEDVVGSPWGLSHACFIPS